MNVIAAAAANIRTISSDAYTRIILGVFQSQTGWEMLKIMKLDPT
jgi:hypothetical protein